MMIGYCKDLIESLISRGGFYGGFCLIVTLFPLITENFGHRSDKLSTSANSLKSGMAENLIWIQCV